MSRVPRIQYTTTPHKLGRNGDGGTLYDIDFQGLLASEGHYRLPGGKWSGGGPLYVHKESIMHSGGTLGTFRQNGSGGEYAVFGSTGFPSLTVSPANLPSKNSAFAAAQAYGLRGFNRTKPGQALVDLFVAGKEVFSDGLPSLPFRKAIFGKKNKWGLPTALPFKDLPDAIRRVLKDYRTLGSEYLNVVFGWKPFVKDLRDLYKATKTWDVALRKLKAQNGHPIRRRATLMDDTSTLQDTAEYGTPYVNVFGGPPTFMVGSTSWARTTTTTTKIWYSAGYRYWIPDAESWQWDAKAKLALFGLLPTPGRLWDAMPWTWLGDWFTDVGEIADALSPTAVENLVQLYGYTMMHKTTKVVCTSYVYHKGFNGEVFFPGAGYFGARCPGVDRTFTSVYTKETKVRTGGFNPFGPDVGLEALTGGQLGILAALGLSKLP